MNGIPIYIAGRGVISALGQGLAATHQALESNRKALRPSTPFPVTAPPVLKVGLVELEAGEETLPRTHRLARLAADQALAAESQAPDAIVLGSTTGGILTTEALLEKGIRDPQAYALHGLGSVAEDLARRCGCKGPVLTVSTACSSGAVAIKLAMELLRSGRCRRVLAGGADSLSRLTYFGFKSLQLVDPQGARPFDRERRGMSVAEGAAMLVLTTQPPQGRPVCLLGAGLSCDAHHATAPHPQGEGAAAAMQAALEDAGLTPAAVDYINLHGTGTTDNDLAEARAISSLFGGAPRPPLSSIKGATGHPLAAAGAIEAVVAAGAIDTGLMPANAGFASFDPELGVAPLARPARAPLNTVMSNSFGFGGNNAALILGRSTAASGPAAQPDDLPLRVLSSACISGAGHRAATLAAFDAGRPCGGCLEDGALCEGLPPRVIRRLKRLPKLALSLATRACESSLQPTAVSMGTGWGALSETSDFLKRLMETGQAYPSPTDFVGSVHNAPAGQIAMLLKAKGANVTVSGGDCSFEQALLSAELLTRHGSDPVLVLASDEFHSPLSPLFDASVRIAGAAADGGGALLLQRSAAPGVGIALVDYRSGGEEDGLDGLIERLGGDAAVREEYGAVLAGCPAAHRELADRQLGRLLSSTRFSGPVIDYRRYTGQFAGASALAAVLGVEMAARGRIPAAHAGGADRHLNGASILLLGLGNPITAVRIFCR